MKKHKVWNAVAHGSIVLSFVFIVLFAIDRFNPSMEFLGSEQSDWLLLLFCLCSLTNGIFSAASLFQRNRLRHKREQQEHKHEQAQ